jgi:hypothetical protein
MIDKQLLSYCGSNKAKLTFSYGGSEQTAKGAGKTGGRKEETVPLLRFFAPVPHTWGGG